MLTVYDNNNGTLVLQDLTNFNVLKMDFESEAGTITGSPFAAILGGTAGQGIVKYTVTSSTFFNVSGTWRVRAIIINSNVSPNIQYTSTWQEFEVDA